MHCDPSANPPNQLLTITALMTIELIGSAEIVGYSIGRISPMNWPDTILELEGEALASMASRRSVKHSRLPLSSGMRGTATASFGFISFSLAWYCNIEPPHLTGWDEFICPPTDLPGLFSAVYDTFVASILNDVEVLYVVGLIAQLTPWLLGGEVGTWELRSREYLARCRVLVAQRPSPVLFRGSWFLR